VPGQSQPNNRFRDPRLLLYPRSAYGWGAYPSWFGGRSYWNPPLDGYGSGFYRGDENENRETARAEPTPPPLPPAVDPADTTSPTQEQARALNQLEAMPEYRRALAELQQAQTELDAITQRVLDKLKANDADYQALLSERDRAADQVEAVQAAARIPAPAEVTPAAQRKLDLKSRITKKEQAAIAADPEARAARARVTEANERVTAMRQQARGAGAAR
jgi:uncharacterized protein YdcH (DUF465 family)